jgi:hypothetical protein
MANRSAQSCPSERLVPEGLTMSVSEYARIARVGENIVRVDIAAERIPHKKMGRRGLIRILTRPALAALGLQPADNDVSVAR